MASRLGVVVCLALLTTFAVVAWSAVTRMSVTTDEPAHAYAAWLIARHGDYRVDREDPPLWKFVAAVPQPADALTSGPADASWGQSRGGVSVPSGTYVRAVLGTPGVDGVAFVNRSRRAMLPVGVALAALTAAIAWHLGGPLAGVIACALACLNPNLLGHAALVKSDVPFALVYLAAAYALWLAGRRLTWPRALALAALVGAAPVVKFSGLILLPVAGVALLARALLRGPWRVLGRDLARTRDKVLVAGAQLALCLGAAYLIVWATYAFRFRPTPDPHVEFNMVGLTGLTAGQRIRLAGETVTHDTLVAWRPDLVTRAVLFANDHRLLPQAWLAGFMYTRASTWLRPTFLLGEIRQVGWWYYFPLAFVFKTPLSALAVLAAAGAVGVRLAVRRAWPAAGRVDRWAAVGLGVPFVAYAAASLASNLNIGIRHIFPVFPFLFIGAGVLLADVLRRHRRRGVVRPAVVVLLLGLAAETLAAFPEYIGYFNVACGGPRGAARLLADSNLDWNQDLILLADWQRRHPERHLYLAYHGVFDPATYGIRATRVTPADERGVVGRPARPPEQPATLAVCVTLLQGLRASPGNDHAYDLVRDTPPEEIVGSSFYLYPYPVPPASP